MIEPEGLDDYIECALWSSYGWPPGVDPEAPGNNEVHLDAWDGDLAPGMREALAGDLDSFLCDHEVQTLIEELHISPEQVAHDFWLTRNHHGVGFWDRGHGKAGDRLSVLAQAYGHQHLYIGDDGLIYAAGLERLERHHE